MRNRKYSMLLLFLVLLIGCKDVTLPVIENHGLVYADFELGVNFNDHMLAIISDDQNYLLELPDQNKLTVPEDLYMMMYTHHMDYLLPQIYYFIPMQHNFDTKKAWETYFNSWETALTSGSTDAIESYIKGSDIEAYIREELTDEAKRDFYKASLVVLLQAKKLYIEEFDFYKDKIWPERALILYSKASYINEMTYALNLKSKWEVLTQLPIIEPELVISLTYYNNSQLDFISINDDKITIYYEGELDSNEMVSKISFLYGRKHLMSYSDALLSEIYETYKALKEDYPLYQILSDLVDGAVSYYNNQIVDHGHDKGILPPDNLPLLRGKYDGIEYLNEHMKRHLFDLKHNTPYMIDGKLHLLGAIYNDMAISDSVTLYHFPARPILIRDDSGLHIITYKESRDSVPEISPNGEKIVFISPYAWGVIGTIHVYNIKTEEMLTLSYNDQSMVKVVKWLDNNRILFVEDNPFGTVTTGGQLKLFDLTDNSIETLVSFEDTHLEVSNVYEDDGWYYTLTTHDEAYDKYTEEHIKLDIN